MYLNQYLRSVLEEGFRLIHCGDIILKLALDADQSPNNTEYRQNVFPGLSSWHAKVFREVKATFNDEATQSYMMAEVKKSAIKKILELREMNDQPKVSVASIKRGFVKPVLKSKVKSGRNDWKGRALKAEGEVKSLKLELKAKDNFIEDLHEENLELQAIASEAVSALQSRLNQIEVNRKTRNQSYQSVSVGL